MRALVTGVEGFVGRHLAASLVGKGVEVSGTYFEEEGLPGLPETLKLFPCDIRDYDRLASVLRTVGPASIYHLAAQSSAKLSFEKPRVTFEVNAVGTLNLLDAARKAGVGPKILLVSSCEVYGERDSPSEEDSPLNPLSPYGSSKASAELIAHQYHRHFNLRIVVARPFNHTGPGQSSVFALPSFAKQIAEIERGVREPYLVVGNLEARRDFLDVRDVVTAYHLLIERGKDGEVYNVASGRPYSIKEVLDILLRLSKKTVEVRVDEERLRPRDAPFLSGKPDKLRKATGFRPRIPLEETLEGLLDFWRQRV